MEILERLFYAATGVVTWESGKSLYRTFKSALADNRASTDYSGDYTPVPSKRNTGMVKEFDERSRKEKEEADKPGTLPCYYEGDKVVRTKGGFVYKGEQGTVVQYSSTKEKYVRVQWVNNQTWVSKNCIELC